MTQCMQQLMICVVIRVRSVRSPHGGLERVDVISRGRQRFARMIEFVRQPFRTECLRAAAHHKDEKHQERDGLAKSAAH